jgi:hypothetical protein
MEKEKIDREIAEEVDLNGTLVCNPVVRAVEAGAGLQGERHGPVDRPIGGEDAVMDFLRQLQRLSAKARAG